MARRYFLLTVTLTLAAGWSQAPPKDCLSLRTRLEVFDAKYSLFRFGGPVATLQTIEDEFGKSQLQPDPATGAVDAVYALEGCVGRVLINSEGIAWMTKFLPVPIPAPPRLESLDQLQDLEDQIKDLKSRVEKLEALKVILIRQAAQLQPAAPPGLPAACEKPEGFLERAWCDHKSGRLKEAIESYTESLRTTPSIAAYTNRALAYFAAGQPTEAMADLTQARTLDVAATAKGQVKVKGYTRSDGTYVAPYTRSAPRKK